MASVMKHGWNLMIELFVEGKCVSIGIHIIMHNYVFIYMYNCTYMHAYNIYIVSMNCAAQ